jgi:protein JSN1
MTSSSADSANRLRSGSLTLADNGVGSASNSGNGFGSVFYSGAVPGRSQLNQVMGSKDLRTIASHTSSNGSSGADDYVTFSTMDYLGLADNSETPRATTFGFEKGPTLPSASHRLQAQTQAQASASQTAASASSANRNRANTVSNYTRPAYKSASSFQDLISAANLGEDRDASRPIGLYDDYSRYDLIPDIATAGHDEYGQTAAAGSTQIKGYKDAGLLNSLPRPRATTIGMLDSPKLRNAVGAGGLAHGSNRIGSSIDLAGYDTYDTGHASSGSFVPTTRNDRGFASMHQGIAPRHNASQSISSMYSAGSNAQGEDGLARSGGKSHAASNLAGENQGQQPTRSLWLGNLDVMTTTNDLMDVFAQYGTIESLRLLPEKVSRVFEGLSRRLANVSLLSLVLCLCELH